MNPGNNAIERPEENETKGPVIIMRLFRRPGQESCEDDCKLLGARVDG
jgi:hypothetical protein